MVLLGTSKEEATVRTRALVLSDARALAVEEVVLQDADDGDVVVTVEYSGISQWTEVDA